CMWINAVTSLQPYQALATLLVLRAVPVVAYWFATPRTTVLQKLGTLVVAAGLAVLARDWTHVPWLAYGGAYLYLIVAGSLVPFTARCLKNGYLTRGGTFVLCLCAFLLLPGVAWPHAMKLVAFVFAWDLVFSSYSYCVELSRSEEPPSYADCLFFLFVNPTLVYSQRGTRIGSASLERSGLLRILLAVFMFLACSLLLTPIFQLIRDRMTGNQLSGIALTDALLCGAVAFVIHYMQASALASLQIGLLRQTGHQIPERYDWPVRAKTLPDFWRRWNRYLGQWALHYVFFPASLRLGRRFRSPRVRTLITVASLLGAFALVGILHDAHASFLSLTPKYDQMMMFLANGALVVLWLGLERLGQRAHDDGRLPPWAPRVATAVSWTCLWCFVSVCALFRLGG
ncbi:MAG: MBOAT family O-acyltransferase, partial [Polyangiaceae bacterium]